MREENDNEELLTRYLLDSLTEEKRLQVEASFLGDDQQYERLLAIEDELFYDYAQGKLSPGERQRFEERFLASEENRKRAMMASALVSKMSEVKRTETPEPALADREKRSGWQSLKFYFRGQSIAMRFSLATLALLLLISLGLIFRTVRLRNEYDRFRTERLAQENLLQRQAQAERARADELNLKLKRELDENTILKRELDEIQSQSGQQRLPSALSLILAPSFTRDRDTGMKKLKIPPGIRQLNFQLNLRGEAEYKLYQAIILTADGAEKWSQDRLPAKQTGSVKTVVLSLPSSLLTDGDYELRLKGYASDGTLEETGNYYYISILR
jgi:anti-sigma factor RsiW